MKLFIIDMTCLATSSAGFRSLVCSETRFLSSFLLVSVEGVCTSATGLESDLEDLKFELNENLSFKIVEIEVPCRNVEYRFESLVTRVFRFQILQFAKQVQ